MQSMLGFVISHAVDAGSKDTCVLEVDDTEDVDTVDSLLDILPPPGMQVEKSCISLEKSRRLWIPVLI